MSIVLPILLAAAASSATSCSTGIWAFEAGGRTIFRLEIDATPARMTATWERPEHYEFDGDSFSRVAGPAVRRSARSVRRVDGDVEVSFDDPTPGATPDIFRLHCAGAGHLDVAYRGIGFEPFDFIQTQAKQASLGPWDARKTYTRTVVRPTNAEMTAIFDADQADRQSDTINWSIVGPADQKRRRRTQDLLDLGGLKSGDDFYHAAFVFQHGDGADDYLKAHLLATVAVARGNSGAVWIASATLDRYLHKIGKPQILGTQYRVPDGAPATQEPYDRTLVSDAMRMALHVPPLSEQEEQRRQYTAEALKAKKP